MDIMIESAMDIATSHEFVDKAVIPLRVEAGEDTERESIQGSALDIAVIKGNAEMISLLFRYGAKIHNI